MQQLFGKHAGNQYLPSFVSLSDNSDAVAKRVAVSVVKDTKNNYLIVKLVNLLPVTVLSSIDMQGIKIAGTKANKFLLQGNPGDKNIKPVESIFEITDQPMIDLPAYSFTVLQFKL